MATYGVIEDNLRRTIMRWANERDIDCGGGDVVSLAGDLMDLIFANFHIDPDPGLPPGVISYQSGKLSDWDPKHGKVQR